MRPHCSKTGFVRTRRLFMGQQVGVSDRSAGRCACADPTFRVGHDGLRRVARQRPRCGVAIVASMRGGGGIPARDMACRSPLQKRGMAGLHPFKGSILARELAYRDRLFGGGIDRGDGCRVCRHVGADLGADVVNSRTVDGRSRTGCPRARSWRVSLADAMNSV